MNGNQIMGDVFSTCEFPLEDIEIAQQMERGEQAPSSDCSQGNLRWLHNVQYQIKC
jgi:hypothetical protein